jgi:putative tryptophan/tyrosine transport system substrate-binding protein
LAAFLLSFAVVDFNELALPDGQPLAPMRRREFITLVGGVAVARPLRAHAQQSERRIGVLMSTAADEPEGQARLAAFRDTLQQLGWTDGRNVRIDARWCGSEPDSYRKCAAELVALRPDAILAAASASVAALQQVSRSVPIVFTNVVDPVGAGFVLSLSRPGGQYHRI